MSEKERNEREWADSANWSGWLGIYRSKRDSRLWVPKRLPWMGWTINLAHPKARLALASLALIPAVVVLAKVARRR